MKKTLLALLLITSIFACSQEDTTPQATNSDRLSFQNMEEFGRIYDKLMAMGSINDLRLWANANSHSTLLDSENSDLDKYSDAVKAILNKNAEYELNGAVIWFDKGKFYRLPQGESTIKAFKSNPDKAYIVGEISAENIRSNPDFSSKAIIPAGGVDARHQREFTQRYYQPCGSTKRPAGGTRKYVHELRTEWMHYSGIFYRRYLYLKVKLEYRSSKGWRAAGEQREISINVSGTADGYGFSVNQNFDCSGDRTILLLQHLYPGNPQWIVNMSGSITQKVKGDLTSNRWVNSSSSLW